MRATCDSTCPGFIHERTAFDAATALPPFATYAQLVDAWAAQNGGDAAAPTEQYAREQGWLADDAPTEPAASVESREPPRRFGAADTDSER